jgi:hypothetical protein
LKRNQKTGLVFENTDCSGSREQKSMGVSDKISEFNVEKYYHIGFDSSSSADQGNFNAQLEQSHLQFEGLLFSPQQRWICVLKSILSLNY